MRRALATLTTAALAAGLGSYATGAAQAATEVAAAPSAVTAPSLAASPVAPDATATQVHRYKPPPIRWGSCSTDRLKAAGAQCGMLTVPMDYNRPTGTKIKIAVSRVKADPKVRYQGAMLVNPGGPGGSGLGLAVLGEFVPDGAGAGYDWIGFDPRGVGSSRPALTCDGNVTAAPRPYYTPYKTAIYDQWISRSKSYAKKCAANGSILKHMRTSSTVADMESLRKALGRTQINLYGFSYGTYLGQMYASKYPKQVRRFVLDGVVDPRRVWYKANLDQNIAFEKSMRQFFNWVADNDEAYGLGSDGQDVRAKWYKLRSKLVYNPQGKLGPSELTDVFLSAGYYVYDWDYLAQVFAAAQAGNYEPAEQSYVEGNPTGPGADNGYAVYAAVQCTDNHWPSKWSTWREDAWQLNKSAPFETWGNTWFNAPCHWWPVEADDDPYINGSKAPAMLLIGETNDAATPFSGAIEVRRRFPKSVLIEGVGGSTHSGSLSGVSCTDDKIAAFLKSGTLPARRAGVLSDVKCAPVPAPEPSVTAAARKSGQPTEKSVGIKNRELRELLDGARGF
ncbi:alpha/beta hydrolase [Janibacter melonis]|uniref:alpha/beta hydrolase n=1 Tax=Janibacter melonis TaxID=262209 RepID=UPI00177CA5F9|nr:alpha/beta hydrolase [Janibacter melonis]